MINIVKLNWLGMWLATCPAIPLSDNIEIQCELEEVLELLK